MTLAEDVAAVHICRIALYGRDFHSLRPEMWINDQVLVFSSRSNYSLSQNSYIILHFITLFIGMYFFLFLQIIDAYFKLIQMRGKEEGFASVYSFSTFFLPALMEQGLAFVGNWGDSVCE